MPEDNAYLCLKTTAGIELINWFQLSSHLSTPSTLSMNLFCVGNVLGWFSVFITILKNLGSLTKSWLLNHCEKYCIYSFWFGEVIPNYRSITSWCLRHIVGISIKTSTTVLLTNESRGNHGQTCTLRRHGKPLWNILFLLQMGSLKLISQSYYLSSCPRSAA